MLAEKKNVVCILGSGFVAEVAEDLHFGGDAGDVSAIDLAAHKTFGWIAKRSTARLRLNAPALLVEGHRVEVKLRPGVVTHDESDRKMVIGNREAERVKSRPDRVHVS